MYPSIALRNPSENLPAANDVFKNRSLHRVGSSSHVFANNNASLNPQAQPIRELHLRTSYVHLPSPSPKPASNGTILVDESNVPRPLRISPDKILIAWRPLIFRIASQHALEAHAYRLHVLDW